MSTNVKEYGFESLIFDYLVNNNGYETEDDAHYDKDTALNLNQLLYFLDETQHDRLEALHILDNVTEKRAFLKRVVDELNKRGVLSMLKDGIKHKHLTFDFYYVRPSEGNPAAAEFYQKNRFSVIRQLHYSKNNPRLALDVCIFLNGLPLITMELKNQMTKQDTADAVNQYKKDRDPKDPLFAFKRCMVHFAVDDSTVMMCTELKGEHSWFLPFNKGYKDGAGNPPNPDGIKTDYLWKEILSKPELSNIIEHFSQVVEFKDEETGKKKYVQIFPRYHQLQVVKSLLNDVKRDGVGGRYLIQHSAGSGKSNSIAWLALQVVDLKDSAGFNVEALRASVAMDSPLPPVGATHQPGATNNEAPRASLFDSIIVVTDRVNLDKQIRNTIRRFIDVKANLGAAYSTEDLQKHIERGTKIIITIVHKFQYVLEKIQSHGHRNYAIIIDEAHSSQNGSLAAKMNMVLSDQLPEDDEDVEDKINRLIEGRKMVKNASYFAFTATPKNKTLEMFGKKEYLPDGTCKPRPHYVYTMKQAIEEGFILDVLRYYTPIQSFYKLIKTSADDPKFDKKKAQRLLRYFVEGKTEAIAQKAAIMVEHFHTQVASKIRGQARAMVVTGSIQRALTYWEEINRLLKARKSPYQTVIAFSGTVDYNGKQVTEADLNEFPSAEIEKKFKKEPYRILVVADKFQTGFDEPLLHTMYIDKKLSDIAAVQTLSRLNRCAPGKLDTFVLDFENDPGIIKAAFDRYYKTTVLSGETDINKLNDLVSEMENLQVYTDSDVDEFVEKYLNNANRSLLDPYLDDCVEAYEQLELEEQIQFKSSAKNFVRTYNFLAAIMPYNNIEWEKLCIFLNLLIGKLPSPACDDDNLKELFQSVELESYRAVAQETMRICLENEDSEINPVPMGKQRGIPVTEEEVLSQIVKEFNDLFGDVEWTDKDRIIHTAMVDLPQLVKADETYQNAMQNSDIQNARAECEDAAKHAVNKLIGSDMEFFKAFAENERFKQWVFDMVFSRTYEKSPRICDGT